MNVLTLRSGAVLHGSQACPDVKGKPTFPLDERQTLARAERCGSSLCVQAFARADVRGMAEAA